MRRASGYQTFLTGSAFCQRSFNKDQLRFNWNDRTHKQSIEGKHQQPHFTGNFWRMANLLRINVSNFLGQSEKRSILKVAEHGHTNTGCRWRFGRRTWKLKIPFNKENILMRQLEKFRWAPNLRFVLFYPNRWNVEQNVNFALEYHFCHLNLHTRRRIRKWCTYSDSGTLDGPDETKHHRFFSALTILVPKSAIFALDFTFERFHFWL